MATPLEPPNLRRSTLDLLGAQGARNLAPLLLLFLLARFTDQPTVGQFSLTLAIATPFFVLGSLGLRTVSLTLNPDVAFASYAKTQLVAVAVAMLAVSVTAIVGSPHLLMPLILVGLLKTADAFADFLSGPLQRRNRTGLVLRASIVYASAASAVAAVLLAATGQLEPTIAGVAAASLLTMFVLLYLPARALADEDVGAAPRPSDIRRILAAGLPLGTTTAVLALVSTFPQYVIAASQGGSETARFAVLLYVYALADLVTATISQAWIPTAQHQLTEGEDLKVLRLSLRRALVWTVAYLPVSAVGLALTAFVYPVVFGPGYTLSLVEAVPLGFAIAALPFAHFLAVAVAIENYYIHSLTLAIFSAAVAICGCIVLIPSLGVAGAFVALAASVVVRALTAAGILLWFPSRAEKGRSA